MTAPPEPAIDAAEIVELYHRYLDGAPPRGVSALAGHLTRSTPCDPRTTPGDGAPGAGPPAGPPAGPSGGGFPADGLPARGRPAGGRATRSRLPDRVIEVGSAGPWVVTAGGRRYLDLGGGGVFLLGHRHPRVVDAVHRQLDVHPLATRAFLEPVTAWAAESLALVTPAGLEHVHFTDSVPEATAAALRLARANGRTTVVSARPAVHGEPPVPGTAGGAVPDVLVEYGDADAMRATLSARAGRACVILEPVHGDGVVVPPRGYVAAVAEACEEYDAFLVMDETATGLGRLGSWWGMDDEGVVPDVLLVGGGLGGGVVTVAATVARPSACRAAAGSPFPHAAAFGGSPLACAAALATVEAVRSEDVVRRAGELGVRLRDTVRRVCDGEAPGLVATVRGRGLLIGIEPADPGDVCELALALLDRGVLADHPVGAPAGPGRVLRLTPPATLGDEELATFRVALEGAVRAVAGRRGR